MNKTTERIIRWGIMGPGRIARKFAEDLRTVPNTELHAVASRDQGRAEAFAREYNAAKTYGSYLALAEDPDVDAIYVATPHAFHKEHSLLCLEHKKAVLCEKPLAMNAVEVNQMIETATTHNTLLMEAMWTAFLPHFVKVQQLLKQGVIGDLRMLKADFGFHPAYDPESRVFKKELGGGSLLDIGIYPIFLALSVMGMPDQVEAGCTLFKNGTDSSCDFTFKYEKGMSAKMQSTFLKETPTKAVIQGDKGKIIMHSRFHQPTSFTLQKEGGEEEYEFDVKTTGYSYEIEHFNALLREGKTESNIMTFKVSQQIIGLLDAVRSKIGLVY